jgi:hypothetical protein
MAQYEAVVASLLPNGKAEIVIRPNKPGIPDAPEISERVCHCATNNSAVRTEAVNEAGALVGDWVTVSRKSSNILKNIIFLIGIPLAGSIGGAISGRTLGGAVMALMALVGMLFGIALGIVFYRRLSGENLLVIDSVIKSGIEISAGGRDRSGCQAGCDRCVPWSL